MSRHLLVASLICSTVLTACTVTLPPPVNAPSAPAAAATATSLPAAPPTAEPTVPKTALTAAPTDALTVTPTAAPVVPSATVPPPKPTALPPTPTGPPTATRAPTDAPTQPPAYTPPPAVPQRPKATVKSANLNVRSGPGSNYPVIGSARQGETMTVTGQTGDCAWLAVNTGSGKAGWVSGDANLVTQSAACSSIPEAPVPPPPAPAPTSPPAPKAAEPAKPAADALGPANQGCYLVQDFLGVPLNGTLTRDGDNLKATFNVAPDSDTIICLDPGRWSYTVDAPPPWLDINGTFDVVAGERLRWPIRGEN